MTGREVKSHIDATEYSSKSDAQKQQIIELLKRDDLDLHGLDKDILVEIFGSGSTTGANLMVARTEKISIAVKIGWGEATVRDRRRHTVIRASTDGST